MTTNIPDLLSQLKSIVMAMEDALRPETTIPPGEQEIMGPLPDVSDTRKWADPTRWPMVKQNPNLKLIEQKTGRPIRDTSSWCLWGAMIDDFGWKEVKAVLNESPGQWPDFYLKALAARKKAKVSMYG